MQIFSGIKIGQFVGIEYIVAAGLFNLKYNLLDSLLVYRYTDLGKAISPEEQHSQ
jgi:hypothetical protein